MSDIRVIPNAPNYIQMSDMSPTDNKTIQDAKSPSLPSEPGKPDSPSDRGFLPDAPTGEMNIQALGGFTASLSPGAVLAALLVKEAAQQNEDNTKEMMTRSEGVQKKMLEQADNIEDGAAKQMAFAVVGAAFNAAGAIWGTAVGVRGEGDVLKVNQTKGQGINTIGQSVGSIFNAVGSYLNAQEEAENKRLEAGISQDNTALEIIRNSMQAQRDLISKSIEFMNTMQASRNQTMNRILG